jgi:hypothetical protein
LIRRHGDVGQGQDRGQRTESGASHEKPFAEEIASISEGLAKSVSSELIAIAVE